MHAGHRVLDADAHVVEPASVFGELARDSMDLPPTTPFVPCGDADKIADQLSNGFDAPSYLRAMDREGIDAVVLYPSIGLFVPFRPDLDARASADACRSYNDWVAAYCADDPSRLAAVGIAPLADPRLAAAEARRCAELGLVGVLVRPNRLYGRNLGDAAYGPLYDALETTGLVLAVHEGLGLKGPTVGADRFEGFALRHLCSHPLEQMTAMATLLLEGVLERHPSLRVAFLESGTGWLPYWLGRLDAHHEWMRDTECAGLPLTPTEYFRRQCVISTDPDDDLAAWTISRVGADHVVWASDFPHPDALYPDAVASFLEEAGEHGLSGPPLDTVLWDTPARFYRVEDRFAGGAPG